MNDHFVQSEIEEITKWWKYQDPGMVFPGGESLDSLRRRVRNFISQMVDRHALENILVISHRSTELWYLCLQMTWLTNIFLAARIGQKKDL